MLGFNVCEKGGVRASGMEDARVYLNANYGRNGVVFCLFCVSVGLACLQSSERIIINTDFISAQTGHSLPHYMFKIKPSFICCVRICILSEA